VSDLHEDLTTALAAVEPGAAPVEVDHTVPIAYLSAFAASSASSWVVGNQHGVLLDGSSLAGQPRFLDYGAAWSIAGSADNFAIATASGRILYFDATTNALVSTLNFPSSSLALSSDGSVLAAAGSTHDAQYAPDRSIKLYSMPAGTLVSSFPFTLTSSPTLQSMVLSGSGTVLGEILTSNSTCDSLAITAIGGSTLWCDDTGQVQGVSLSPDGTLVAASTAVATPNAVTTIYKNGSLVTSVPGSSLGWLDNNRVLAGLFTTTSAQPPVYASSVIYDSSGNKLSTPPIPSLDNFVPDLPVQAVTADSVYSPSLNSIYSLTSGAALWQSASPSSGISFSARGAVTDPEVVFTSGSVVLAEPY